MFFWALFQKYNGDLRRSELGRYYVGIRSLVRRDEDYLSRLDVGLGRWDVAGTSKVVAFRSILGRF